MRNTKRLIFDNLSVTRQATINKLAEQLDLNPITVRHHLLNLEKEGLVTSNEQRHGVGRPRLVFRLTGDGQQAKTANYHSLADQLLSTVEEVYGSQSRMDLLEAVGKKMAQAFETMNSNDDMPIFLDDFCENLAAEGFNLNWELKNNRLYIRNSNCPYYHLHRAHPEICTIDRAFFAQVFGRELRFETGSSARDAECVFSYEV